MISTGVACEPTYTTGGFVEVESSRELEREDDPEELDREDEDDPEDLDRDELEPLPPERLPE
jgi:hypothetical protein